MFGYAINNLAIKTQRAPLAKVHLQGPYLYYTPDSAKTGNPG